MDPPLPVRMLRSCEVNCIGPSCPCGALESEGLVLVLRTVEGLCSSESRAGGLAEDGTYAVAWRL